MEHEDLSFTTPKGEKVYGSPPRPPEDMKERVRQQQEREFQLARELSRDLKPEKSGEAGSRKDNIVEMPSRKKIAVEKESGKKEAA